MAKDKDKDKDKNKDKDKDKDKNKNTGKDMKKEDLEKLAIINENLPVGGGGDIRKQLLDNIGNTVIILFMQDDTKCGMMGFMVKVMPDYVTIKITSTKNETVQLEDIHIPDITRVSDYKGN